MHGLLIRASATALLLCSSPPLVAAPVYRCAAPGGHISFTHHGCPAGQQQQLQSAFNATPGMGGSPTPWQASLGTARSAPRDRTSLRSRPLSASKTMAAATRSQAENAAKR
ncbi:DUF4124 domain-containing protein [Azotobacter chroococcum]